MQLRRAAVGVALVAMVVVAGCDRAGEPDSAGGGSGSGEAVVEPAADQATGGAPDQAAGGAAAQVRLVDLGNRVVRTASVDLEVGEGDLNKTINDATDVVLQAKGLYVGSSTSVPEGKPAGGQVTSGSRWTRSSRCSASSRSWAPTEGRSRAPRT
jgi:hypothetical protein